MLYRYFDVQVTQETKALFRQNRLTRRIFVFQSNCCPNGNEWHAPGYGWGVWRAL